MNSFHIFFSEESKLKEEYHHQKFIVSDDWENLKKLRALIDSFRHRIEQVTIEEIQTCENSDKLLQINQQFTSPSKASELKSLLSVIYGEIPSTRISPSLTQQLDITDNAENSLLTVRQALNLRNELGGRIGLLNDRISQLNDQIKFFSNKLAIMKPSRSVNEIELRKIISNSSNVEHSRDYASDGNSSAVTYASINTVEEICHDISYYISLREKILGLTNELNQSISMKTKLVTNLEEADQQIRNSLHEANISDQAINKFMDSLNESDLAHYEDISSCLESQILNSLTQGSSRGTYSNASYHNYHLIRHYFLR
jgi:hypothetical protein